jgi:hypothetical protein
MMPFLQRKQTTASHFASAFAPKTAFGIELRNFLTLMMAWPFVAQLLLRHQMHDDVNLPVYHLHANQGEDPFAGSGFR